MVMNDSQTALQLVIEKLDFQASNSQDRFLVLSQYLDELIQQDFNQVITILYRMDVSEQKVRSKLAQPLPGETAGTILAHLLIEREMQKMEWRRRYRDGEI